MQLGRGFFSQARSSLRQGRKVFTGRPRIEITYNYCHDLYGIPAIEPSIRCEIQVLVERDMPLLLHVWNVSLDRMYRRLRRGDKCYSVFIDGKIAHYEWVQTQGWHYIQPAGRWWHMACGQLMIYHVRVADWARGNRLYPYGLTYTLREYARQGYDQAWIYTTASNTASQKGIERAGFQFVEGYRALVLGEWYIPLPGKLAKKL